jgi:preprotein translocase subunit YajC
MFSSPAYASAGAAPSGTAALLAGPIPMMLIVMAIFYFLVFRPQGQRMKQHKAMVAAVKKNDIAVTNGGLIGKVTKVDENEIELEIASGVRVKVMKTMLSDVRPFGAKPAND